MTQHCSPDSDVTDFDRRYAEHILADFAVFEEGIENEEKLTEWIRNVRVDLERNFSGAAAQGAGWRLVDTAPHETYVLLGWMDDGIWNCQTGMASPWLASRCLQHDVTARPSYPLDATSRRPGTVIGTARIASDRLL